MSSSTYLKPTTRGLRNPQDNGSPSDLIANPPRYAEIGGLTSARKLGQKGNAMKVRAPGNTQHKAAGVK